MTACAGSMCKAKMQKRHMHMAGGDHYCCAECAAEHMGKKAYASDHHDTRMEQYPENEYQWLQHEFEAWLEDDHGELHHDDDRDELWAKFMLEKFGEIEKYAKKSFTLKEAREILTPLGVVITTQDGEYRVNFKGGKEDTAYYTNDISDAVGTGKKMKKSSTDDGKKTFAQKDLYKGDPGYEGELVDLGQEHGFLGEDLGQYLGDEPLGYRDTENPYGYNTLEGVAWDEGYEAGFSDASVSMR